MMEVDNLEKENDILKNRRIEPLKEQQKMYDLSQVLMVSRGDNGFVRSVIQMFIVKTPIYIESILKAFEAGNYKEMGDIAHQLKQSVYAMGINNLRTPIMALILVGRNNTPDEDLPIHVENLKQAADLVIKELKNDFGM